MIDEQPTSETVPDEAGANFMRSEKQVGAEAYKLLRRYDRLLDKHEKVISEIHQVILEFGRKLAVGQEMYGSGKEFGQWVERRHLNTSKMGENQQERSAAMKIARLCDTGSELGEDDLAVGMVPCKLDLTHCQRTRPTDIIKWARKEQPHLFPDLSSQAVINAPKSKPQPKDLSQTVLNRNLPDDIIPNFRGKPEPDWRRLLTRVLHELEGDLPRDLRAAIEAALR